MDRKKLTLTALAVAAVLTLADLALAFFVAAPVIADMSLDTAGVNIGGKLFANPILFSQKIFYFHVPVAITSFVVFFFTAYYGVRFLMTRDRKYDTMARIATEVTLIFVTLTMLTGDLWTRVEWGVWWVWEPRLTTYLIMMLLVIGYFVLRASVEDEEKRAVYASAFPDVATRTIAVAFVVDEGPRVYIERINIVGNERTKDYVIRREFRLAEGDAYNPLMVDRAKKRLSGLGLFKNVEVKRRPGSAQDRVVLDVEITEQSTGELSFGAGYSTSEGVIGDVSITERNFLGNGQFLRLKLAGSIERFQIDLSFTEPRFLDYNLSAGFDIFHKEVDQRSESGFRQRKTGAVARLGFPLAESLWMQTHYSLARDQIFDVTENASLAIKEACGDPNPQKNKVNCSDAPYWTSLVGTTITYDARNHPRKPTRGFYLQLDDEFAGLGGDVQYWRVGAEARAYYPITEKITLIGRAIGGHIQGWGGEDVRLLDLYFKGGETVRGFDRSGFGPRDLSTNDALGGQSYWAATAEVRFPLPLIPEDIGLSGAVFADAGSLFGAAGGAKRALAGCTTATGAGCLVDESSIRSSVGASLMWDSPVGPLRMDFAKTLSKESFDQEQVFRFGASTKF